MCLVQTQWDSGWPSLLSLYIYESCKVMYLPLNSFPVGDIEVPPADKVFICWGTWVPNGPSDPSAV